MIETLVSKIVHIPRNKIVMFATALLTGALVSSSVMGVFFQNDFIGALFFIGFLYPIELWVIAVMYHLVIRNNIEDKLAL